MTTPILSAQVRAQNLVRDLRNRAADERGEIGSQLILMAILVGAAVLAAGPLRGAISDLVGKITSSIGGQDAGGTG